jgi:ABC-2 type transport system ATP-binding protein
MKAIEVEALSRNYGEIKALENIDLNIDRGEIFGVIGPDGAGKSSLFRILVTLLLPSSGFARMSGYDVVKDYRTVRNIVGYMAGRFSLYHDLSVEENLTFYARVFGTSISANYDLIRDIYEQIEPFKKRRAGKLSGGMKQKLALCCALIHRPEILVLDEPTTGVDAVSRKEFWDLLQRIRQGGITIIVSTPYMDEASRCDRVALLQKGQLLKIGDPGDINRGYDRPLFSVRAVDSNYRLLLKLRKEEWCHSAWLFGQDIHLGIGDRHSPEAVEKEISTWEEVAGITKISASVEDIFIDLMPSGS